MALSFGPESPDGIALFFALATGVYMSLFGSLIGKLTPSKVEANPELERIRAGVLGAMRHADAKFSAGDAESGINTLIDAFNVAKIAFGFCDPVTQLVIHEITLQTYNVGLKEAGLKFETLRWILHIEGSVASDEERRQCWIGKRPDYQPDADVRAYFQANRDSLQDLVKKFWLPTPLPKS